MTEQSKHRGQQQKDEASCYVHGAIEAHPPKSLVDQHNAERKEDAATHDAERKEDRRRETHKLFLEILTLMVLGIYTSIAIWQGYLTRKAITNNAKQFQIDQRPYVWHSNVTDPANVKIVAGQRMWINISLINFGRAPALKDRGIARIFIGENAIHDADLWFAAYGEKALPNDPNDTGIVVPPGIPSGEITEKSAFGGGGYFTAMSDKVLTQDDANYILHSNETVAIVVHTEYFDAYGTRYWSNFCLSRFDTGVFPNCQRHNEIH